MDGEPDPTLSGPGPGGETPDDPNAAWRRPDSAVPDQALAPNPTIEPLGAHTKHGLLARAARTVRTWWSELAFVQMWHVVVVLAVLATAGFGGLDEVDKTPQTFDLGKPFDNGEFTITVHKASLLPEITGGEAVLAKEKPGRMYLAVVAEVTNDADRADVVANQFALRDVADVQGPFGTHSEDPSVYRIEDGSNLILLQPDLTEKVAVVWSVPTAAVPPGSQVSIQVPYRTFSRGLVNYGEGWIDSNETATTTVRVEVPS
ncbi:hypothetical protein [Mycobacteroides salmoniphilum]|uniref:hypothetical protein n=1 Tax=Mycobacteroides salmoniphilum TaxID=404941 RepID=UPI0009936551|nr:hypothetical protein [Mycobacteroides salmoniphilum]QCH23803.1 hypothetical protein DSM43276_02064 [Mycobacteroides salmoniphilum]